MGKTLIVRPPGPEDRFEKQYKWDPVKRRLENTVFGVAYQVIDLVDAATGVVHHEAVALISRRVELHVVVRGDMHLGFVFQRRSAVIPLDVARRLFEDDPGKIPDLFALPVVGIEEYECAHGLALRPLEEAKEEIGLVVLESHIIGHVKESPPLGGVAHILYAVKVGTQQSGEHPEDGEQIRHVDFFPPEEVRNIPTICGLTQAALWRFRSWGFTQPDGSFWKAVAVRL